MADSPIRVLGFAGSLRRGSFNKALLHSAREFAPDGMNIQIYDLEGLPFFNADVEAEGDPEAVQDFKQAIDAADAVLIATPEYQHGVSGVLKNALDWASRPAHQAAITRKPVAIMGASPGRGGTMRAQEQLRQTLIYNQCRMVMRPEVFVNTAREKFDDKGLLTDEKSIEMVQRLLAALVEVIEEDRVIAASRQTV